RKPAREIFDPAMSTQIVSMLETVTGPGGSGTRASVPNYSTAGKTGTTRKATAGGYESRYVSVFAGMVPADQPRRDGVVVVHDPVGKGYYGGLVSAPVFGKVMEGATRLLDIPPDRVLTALNADPLPMVPTDPEADAVGNEIPVELLQFAE